MTAFSETDCALVLTHLDSARTPEVAVILQRFGAATPEVLPTVLFDHIEWSHAEDLCRELELVGAQVEVWPLSAVSASQPQPIETDADVLRLATEVEDTGVILLTPGNKKIQAIKVVREVTGAGLGDAKAMVDSAPTVLGIWSRTRASFIQKHLEEIGAEADLAEVTGAAELDLVDVWIEEPTQPDGEDTGAFRRERRLYTGISRYLGQSCAERLRLEGAAVHLEPHEENS